MSYELLYRIVIVSSILSVFNSFTSSYQGLIDSEKKTIAAQEKIIALSNNPAVKKSAALLIQQSRNRINALMNQIKKR